MLYGLVSVFLHNECRQCNTLTVHKARSHQEQSFYNSSAGNKKVLKAIPMILFLFVIIVIVVVWILLYLYHYCYHSWWDWAFRPATYFIQIYADALQLLRPVIH